MYSSQEIKQMAVATRK